MRYSKLMNMHHLLSLSLEKNDDADEIKEEIDSKKKKNIEKHHPSVAVDVAGTRRNLKTSSLGTEIDLEGKKFNDKDALEPGINIFQDGKESKDIMDEGDLGVEEDGDKTNKNKKAGNAKKKSKPMKNIKVDDSSVLKTNDLISNDDIESISINENKKLTDNNEELQKKISETLGSTRTFSDNKNKANVKTPLTEKTGTSRQDIGMGLENDHFPDFHGEPHHEGPLPITLHHDDHHVDGLAEAHVENLPVQPLRHTGKVALVPAILHTTDAHYDHESGHYHPEETRVEPVMSAHPVQNLNHGELEGGHGGDLEHALGVMGDGGLHHYDTHHAEDEHHYVDHPAVTHNLDNVDVHPFQHNPQPPKRKPNVIKVEFVPDKADIKATGNTKVGSKKGGSVRVQFIPGDNESKTVSPIPGETRQPSVSSLPQQTITQSSDREEKRPENVAISTASLTSKLKDKMEGKEVCMWFVRYLH